MKLPDSIMSDKNLIRLQYFFSTNSTKKFTHAQIKKIVKLSKITLTKWLDILIDVDFIKYEQIGRTYLVWANSDNSVVKQVKILFNVENLYGSAKEIASKLECEVYIFGSAARGEDTESSDIDLLIIGDRVAGNAVNAELASLEKLIERKITFQIFTKLEWAQAARKDKPFYERGEKDKIRVA